MSGCGRSESIGNLAEALALAQGQMGTIIKDKTVDMEITNKDTGAKHRVRYNYSDLATVIEAVRAPLSGNGLAHIQVVGRRGEMVVVTTGLFHKSGEWIQSEFFLNLGKKPQDAASAITYARRYTLSALLGVASEEDDDAQAAQAAAAREERREKRQQGGGERRGNEGGAGTPLAMLAKLAAEKFPDVAEPVGLWARSQGFQGDVAQADSQSAGRLVSALQKLQAKTPAELRAGWFARLAELGLSEDAAYAWAAKSWGWAIDPAKNRASMSLTPAGLVQISLEALRKVTPEQAASFQQKWQAAREDKAVAIS